MSSNPPDQPITWLTFPGLIIDEDNNSSLESMKRTVEKYKSTVSFIADDVFEIQGLEDITLVITNRFKPVYHFLNIPVENFRREFFNGGD